MHKKTWKLFSITGVQATVKGITRTRWGRGFICPHTLLEKTS